MEKNIIKVGDSLYLKMDSMEQLAAIVKFLDDSKLKKAMDELRKSMETDPLYPLKKDIVDSIKKTGFNSLSPKEVEGTLFDHEARLNHMDECLAKLEKAVSDIPKTMGKITDKMMEANMGDKDKDLKSFSMNFYWNYDDSEGEEDDD